MIDPDSWLLGGLCGVCIMLVIMLLTPKEAKE